jgi:hypothetical protein
MMYISLSLINVRHEARESNKIQKKNSKVGGERDFDVSGRRGENHAWSLFSCTPYCTS